jgi:hypothetical protein
MQVYNARIVEIARTAREVVAFLQSKRNTFVSLFRLPPEVICEIVLCLNMKGSPSRLMDFIIPAPNLPCSSFYLGRLGLFLHTLHHFYAACSTGPQCTLTLRQGTSLQNNPMMSVTRPTRYTKYECIGDPRSSPLEWELSPLLARTETLDLSSSFAMSNSPLEFISSACFDQPMPLLVTLKLRAATLSYRSPSGPRNHEYWFAGKTPRLRHISFHRLFAPWDDPIYKNLVSLALHYPSVPISPVELANILAKSPMLQELVLQGVLEAGLEESRPPR